MSFNFKIIITGDSGVGKTTFLQRHLTGEFLKAHVLTLGVSIIQLSFKTTRGSVIFDCWDIGGTTSLKDLYAQGAQGSIIMFDVANMASYENAGHWQVSGVPTVLCGNKVDNDRQVRPKDIKYHRAHPSTYYCDLSVKSNYNFEKPFLVLARILTGDPDLQLIASEY